MNETLKQAICARLDGDFLTAYLLELQLDEQNRQNTVKPLKRGRKPTKKAEEDRA